MRTLGALIFPDFELLDLFGPLEMFGMLPNNFELKLVSQSGVHVQSKQGPCVLADATFKDMTDFDVILVPGGKGTRHEINNQALLNWLKERAHAAQWVLTVCTGSALLAKTGLLDGRSATTNKLAFDWVVGNRPQVKWQHKARWAEDGKFFTSSGVSAGMDMSLAAIARMHDIETAEQITNWAEYNWNRDHACDPYAKSGT
ncbi:DJ-1/PfpI family protein [Magnetovibrio sp. PR-2]|uniref:DJ-1/PfpI family protein n=1 Tax=Magnetovibrio sp. PR-2 TaxID=3120356 RepID=UPI002FCE354E